MVTVNQQAPPAAACRSWSSSADPSHRSSPGSACVSGSGSGMVPHTAGVAVLAVCGTGGWRWWAAAWSAALGAVGRGGVGARPVGAFRCGGTGAGEIPPGTPGPDHPLHAVPMAVFSQQPPAQADALLPACRGGSHGEHVDLVAALV